MEPGFVAVRVAVVLVTNEHTAMDESTVAYVVERLTGEGHQIVDRRIVEDTAQVVKAQFLRWFADPEIDVVLAVAGIDTESTRAALAPLVTKQIEGFTDLFRLLTYNEIGTGAMLVDVTAAQCGSTFVFVLPASQGAVKTAIDKLLIPQLDARTKPRNLVMRMTKRRPAKPAPVEDKPTELDERDLTESGVPVPIKTETTAVGVPPPPARRSTPPPRRPPTPPPVTSFESRTPAPPPPRRPPTPPPVTSFEGRTPPPPPPRRPPTPPPVTAADAARIPSPGRAPTPAAGVTVKPLAGGPLARSAMARSATPATGVGVARSSTGSVDKPASTRSATPAVGVAVAKSAPLPESAGSAANTNAASAGTASPASGAAAVAEPAGDTRAVDDADGDASKPNSLVPITPFSALRSVDPAMAASSVVVDDELNATIDHVAVAGSVRASNKTRPPPVVEDAVILEGDLEALVERGPLSTGTEPLPIIAASEPMFDARELAKPRARRRRRLAILVAGAIVVVGGGVLAFHAMAGGAGPARIATTPPMPPPPRPAPVVAADAPAGDPALEAIDAAAADRVAPADAAAAPGLPVTIDAGAGAPKPRPPPIAETPTPETPAPETPAPDTVKSPDNPGPGGECDEVSCILENYGRACCARWKPAAKPAKSGVPEELDAAMIKAGVSTMRPVIIRCGEQASVKGTVKLAVTVAASGHVDSVAVASAPDADLGECVAAAMRNAAFPRTQRGGSFSYPFVF